MYLILAVVLVLVGSSGITYPIILIKPLLPSDASAVFLLFGFRPAAPVPTESRVQRRHCPLFRQGLAQKLRVPALINAFSR